jgi:hypothetical protein
MNIQALQSRSWNGTPISRRTTDGYVNATAMCRANGRQWSKYRETDRCQEYIDALAETSDFGGLSPIETRAGNGGGTWVHPQVAVDLARWISAPFAVWMDGWFLEELEVRGSQVRDTPPEFAALPVEAMLTTLERAAILMEQFGGLDDRDQLLFRDLTRNTVLRAAGSTIALPPAPEDEELTLSDAWLEVTGSPLPRRDGPGVGRLVAALYREEFDKEPPTRMQYVDGAPRQVKSYKRGWLVEAVKAVWSRVSD